MDNLNKDVSSIVASVIIPAFNAEKYVLECLQSVFEQKVDFIFEVIVVDDGSCDQTAMLVSEKYPQARLISKINGGPGSARNLGVNEALSDILVFIDSDDVMLEGRLQYQVEYMIRNPDVKLTFGNQRFQKSPELNYNLDKQLVRNLDEFCVVDNAYSLLIVEGNVIANTTTAVWKDAYIEVGGQPEDYFVGEDYAMCCAVARKYPVAVTNRYLTWYRQDDHGNLMSSKHTYIGPPTVLAYELYNYHSLLSKAEYDKAIFRFNRLINMLLRYQWMVDGRSVVIATIKEFGCLLNSVIRFKWIILSMFPSWVGRLLRQIKNLGKSTHR